MTNTIEGRPINGTVSFYSDKTPKDQHHISELLEALDALFAFPEVEAVRWEQYTPYFNDGEACTFSIYDSRVKLAGVDDEAGDYGDGFIDSSGAFPPGYFDTHAYERYVRPANWSSPGHYELPEGKIKVNWDDMKFYAGGVVREDIQKAFESFNKILCEGHHETQLYKSFGDPAQITATREGFDVEHYDHD